MSRWWLAVTLIAALLIQTEPVGADQSTDVSFGGVRRLEVGGPIVGLFEGATFQEETVVLESGEVGGTAEPSDLLRRRSETGEPPARAFDRGPQRGALDHHRKPRVLRRAGRRRRDRLVGATPSRLGRA